MRKDCQHCVPASRCQDRIRSIKLFGEYKARPGFEAKEPSVKDKLLMKVEHCDTRYFGSYTTNWKMALFQKYSLIIPSSGMLGLVTLIITDASEELSIIWVTRIGEIGTLAIISNRRTLIMEAIRCSETWVLNKSSTTFQKDGILYIHSREKLKAYIAVTGWAL
jgi:hypothetical protein